MVYAFCEEIRGFRFELFVYNIPESFKAFCNIVSLIAANTSRILDVSVACVKLKEFFFLKKKGEAKIKSAK
jgi:hypothetical protein